MDDSPYSPEGEDATIPSISTSAGAQLSNSMPIMEVDESNTTDTLIATSEERDSDSDTALSVTESEVDASRIDRNLKIIVNAFVENYDSDSMYIGKDLISPCDVEEVWPILEVMEGNIFRSWDSRSWNSEGRIKIYFGVAQCPDINFAIKFNCELQSEVKKNFGDLEICMMLKDYPAQGVDTDFDFHGEPEERVFSDDRCATLIGEVARLRSFALIDTKVRGTMARVPRVLSGVVVEVEGDSATTLMTFHLYQRESGEGSLVKREVIATWKTGEPDPFLRIPAHCLFDATSLKAATCPDGSGVPDHIEFEVTRGPFMMVDRMRREEKWERERKENKAVQNHAERYKKRNAERDREWMAKEQQYIEEWEAAQRQN